VPDKVNDDLIDRTVEACFKYSPLKVRQIRDWFRSTHGTYTLRKVCKNAETTRSLTRRFPISSPTSTKANPSLAQSWAKAQSDSQKLTCFASRPSYCTLVSWLTSVVATRLATTRRRMSTYRWAVRWWFQSTSRSWNAHCRPSAGTSSVIRVCGYGVLPPLRTPRRP
jgi:hypothetical protein